MIIIPSGRPKIWDKRPETGPVPANQAYTGTFHRLCQEYAESQKEPYIILSPWYGFLKPDEMVPHSYDVRFTQRGTTAETIQLTDLQIQWQNLEKLAQTIAVLGGKKFVPLMQEIAGPSQRFSFPLVGLGGIGHMQAALKEAIRTGQPL